MADFTVIIDENASSVPATDVAAVGAQIAMLAKEFANLKVHPDVQLHSTSKMKNYVEQAATWTDDAQAMATAVFNALSIRLHKADGSVEEVGYTEAPDAKDIFGRVKLVFVFEEEGEMVVPIPHQKQIDRGIKDAPLGLPSVYGQILSKEAADILIMQLHQRAQTPGTKLNALAADRGEDFALIVDQLKDIAETVLNDNMTLEKRKAIFYEQLGDYSVTQCGH